MTGPWIVDHQQVKVGDYIARIVAKADWSPQIFIVERVTRIEVQAKLLWMRNNHTRLFGSYPLFNSFHKRQIKLASQETVVKFFLFGTIEHSKEV